MIERLPLVLAVLVLACAAGAAAQPPVAGQVIPLWPEGVPDAMPNAGPEGLDEGRVINVHVPTLVAHPAPAATATGVAVIICPGGGYQRLAIEKEANAVAVWLNSIGVSGFVLKYRLKEYGQPAPLRDALRAIRLVRSNAAAWHVDPARIGIMGFSAGGHVAATASTMFDAPEGSTGAALDRLSARPDFAVLAYPVITMKAPYAHAGSRTNLLGPSPAPALEDHWSAEMRVTPRTPPTFIVHGADDASVPVENSLQYFGALRRAGVPAELHVYEHGPHGFGLATDLGPTSGWITRCAEWMAARGLVAKR